MKPWGLADWMRQAIGDAYAAGEKLEAISAEFGVKPHYVSMLARRRGIPPRQRQKKRSHSIQPMLSERYPLPSGALVVPAVTPRGSRESGR